MVHNKMHKNGKSQPAYAHTHTYTQQPFTLKFYTYKLNALECKQQAWEC